MADKAIGSLVEATVINDADRFVLEQSGQAKQISGATMISELAEALDGHGGIQSIDLVSGEGNVKTYRITFADGTTYDYEVRDGESGNYAVVAGNLAPYSDASGATQSIPFLSQGTGRGNGSATVSAGNYCQLKKKLGNTVGVNQLCDIADGTQTGAGNQLNTHTTDFFTDRYYLFMVRAVFPSTPTSQGGSGFPSNPVLLGFWKGTSYRRYQFAYSSSGVYIAIAKGSSLAGQMSNMADTTITLQMFPNVGETVTFSSVRVIDLSRWFGSNDRIPSDLLSHPENWGRYFAGSLAYNAGTLESADGTVLTSIGRNVWDEVAEAGKISTTTGENVSGNTEIRSKNFIPVIPNTTYCPYIGSAAWMAVEAYDADKNFVKNLGGINSTATFTTPSNCHYIRFYTVNTYGTTYKNDITISLYYSGESGYSEYYPYSVLAEVDSGSEVLRSAGTVADEKTPDGTITRRVGVVDLGTIDYFYESNYSRFSLGIGVVSNIKIPSATDTPNARVIPFKVVTSNAGWAGRGGSENLFCIDPTGYLRFYTTQYSDVATFKSAMSGVYLYYELATPTTEQGTAFAENIPCDPVGSKSWENTNGIPQGAEIFYPYDYAGTLDSMIDALPSADGTYTLKATVANGKITYSWVAD